VPTASFFTVFNSQAPREQTTDRRSMIDARYDHVAGRTRIAADFSFDRAYYNAVYPFAAAHDEVPVLINHDASIARAGAPACGRRGRWPAGRR
jgi:hypothetical protein